MRLGGICLALCMVLPLWGQSSSDFAARFVKLYRGSQEELHCITVSPQMLERIIKVSGDRHPDNKRIQRILAHIKSVRIVDTWKNTMDYREKALDLLHKNEVRYVSFVPEERELSCDDCLWVRQKKDRIVELVMLLPPSESRFTIVNVTGELDKALVLDMIELNDHELK